MPILTEAEIRSFTSRQVTFSERQAYKGRKGGLFEARTSAKTTVFLSHSHTDKEIIEETVSLLSKIGVNVYVDWQDDSMPASTSGETAARLKEKIKACSKFVLLASPQAIRSNWVNWELGFGDSVKYIENIALFPFVKSSTASSWVDAEYLQIYPYIERDPQPVGNFYTQPDPTFSVRYPDGRRISLKVWLNK